MCAILILAFATLLNAFHSHLLFLNTNSSNLVLGIGGCTLAIHVVACSLLLVEKVSLVALAWLLLDPALLWLHTHILRAANHGAVQQDESDGDTKSIQEGGPLWDTKWLVVNALLAGLTLGLSFAPLNLFVKIASGVAILFVLLFETHTLAPDIFSSASVTTVEGLLGTLVWSCKLVLGGASVLAAVLRHGSMSAQGMANLAALVLLVVPLAMATLMMQLLTGSKLDTPIVSPTNRSHADEADLKSLSGRGKKHSLDEVLSSIENSLGDLMNMESGQSMSGRLLEMGNLYRITENIGDEIDVDEEAEKLLLKLGMATASTLSTLTRMPTGETSLCTGCKLEMTTSDSAHHQRVSQPGSRRGSQAGNGGQAEGGQAGISEATLAAMLVGPDGLAWKEVVESLQEHSSDIAHDMKNPLNGVLALSQNVVAGTFGEIPKVACDQLNVVRACAYHLLNMINMERDMLKMMNGGDGELNSSLSQISNQVDEVLKRMLPMVGTRLAVNYEPNPAHTILADDQRLYQVLHCVIANAFKYTRKGSVTIDTFNSADGLYGTFRCEDTGTGLSPEQLEKFNRPIQASCAEQLGLGLMMVKRLMAAFGGLLRVSNRESGGASVELIFMASRDAPSLVQGNKKAATSAATAAAVAAATIAAPSFSKSLSSPNSAATITSRGSGSAPAAAASVVVSPPPAAARATPTPSVAVVQKQRRSVDERSPTHGAMQTRTNIGDEAKYAGGGSVAGTELGVSNEEISILIVDDDPVNMTILEDLLRGAGYATLLAGTGVEALEVYLTCDPPVKLVLLDVTLPDMSGHEVCLKMRSLTPGVPPPIIMISGKASTKDVIKGLQAGSSDYITKPFQPQEVLARIETQLRLFMGEVQQLQEAAERNGALLSQILPPHILSSLKGGARIMVEKFPDVALLAADIAGFSNLAAHADTSDCIITLNRIFSSFDTLTDKYGMHKIDVLNDSYIAAIGHHRVDQQLSPTGQIRRLLDCAKEMLQVVSSMSYPSSLGKMELRIGIHVGPVYAGVLGVKYPRYCFFGTTQKLALALKTSALPMTIHISDMVYHRVKSTGDTFIPLTNSSFPGLGIIKTHIVQTEFFDHHTLDGVHVPEYLGALYPSSNLQVIQTLIGLPHPMRQGGPSYNNIYSSVSGYSNSALNPESSGPMSQKSALIPQHFGLMAQNSRQMPQHFGLMAQKSAPVLHQGDFRHRKQEMPDVVDKDEPPPAPKPLGPGSLANKGAMDFMADNLKAERSQETVPESSNSLVTLQHPSAPHQRNLAKQASKPQDLAATTPPPAAASAVAAPGGTAGGKREVAMGGLGTPLPSTSSVDLSEEMPWDEVDNELLTELGMATAASKRQQSVAARLKQQQQVQHQQHQQHQQAAGDRGQAGEVWEGPVSDTTVPDFPSVSQEQPLDTAPPAEGLSPSPFKKLSRSSTEQTAGAGGTKTRVSDLHSKKSFKFTVLPPGEQSHSEGWGPDSPRADLVGESSFSSLRLPSPRSSPGPLPASRRTKGETSTTTLSGGGGGEGGGLESEPSVSSSVGQPMTGPAVPPTAASLMANRFGRTGPKLANSVGSLERTAGGEPRSNSLDIHSKSMGLRSQSLVDLQSKLLAATLNAKALARAAGTDVHLSPLAGPRGGVPRGASTLSAPTSLLPPSGKPKDLSELLNGIQLGYYAKQFKDQGITIDDLQAMDDASMRKAGLVTSRSRLMVTDELRRLGLKQ